MYTSGKLAPEEGAGHSDGDTTSWAVPCCAAQHLPSQSPVCVCVRPAQHHLCFWFCLFSPNFHFHFLHPWGCWCHPLGFLSDIFMDSQVFYIFFFFKKQPWFPLPQPRLLWTVPPTSVCTFLFRHCPVRPRTCQGELPLGLGAAFAAGQLEQEPQQRPWGHRTSQLCSSLLSLFGINYFLETPSPQFVTYFGLAKRDWLT